ncbi:MAG: sugar transferase [Ectothiorhodospiraceae bacterium]|nr:sugar transferase [Chromatiales bacterium]MCP5155948.1 sugar transferase [Ectothiorhodospiraceae bacterium]
MLTQARSERGAAAGGVDPAVAERPESMPLARPRAVVLAGGPGTTECPLANVYPPLLFPMSDGKPLLLHQLGFLKASGFREVAIALSDKVARREQIERLLEEFQDPDFQIIWQVDRGNRGPAGALKDLQWFVDDAPVLVMLSDVWPEGLDLTGLWQAHRRSGAAATVALQVAPRSRADLENVRLGPDGRLGDFSILHESRDNRRPHRPAGVYLLEPSALDLVRAEGYVDLREQLFPHLREHGHDVRGYVLTHPLERVGNLTAYLELNQRLLLGAEAREPTATRGGSWPVVVGQDTEVAPSALLLGPVTIGDRCVIGDRAVIVGPTVICSDSRVGAESLVRESMLWPGACIGDGASLEYGLMTDGCVLADEQRVVGAVVDGGEGLADGLNLTRPQGVSFVVSRRDGRLRDGSLAQLRRRAYLVAKRLVDVLAPIMALPILIPLLAVVAIAVRLDSPGPAFYRQRRCGRNGREFRVVKFRTMVTDADARHAELRARSDIAGPMFKMRDDPRVTRVGYWLRRTSLDELPQLWNVVCGDMTLVGPRPLAMHEMAWSPRWRDIRLRVKPGLTGLWQVSGRSELGFDGWIEYDIAYVRSQSMWVDLRILLKTFKVLLTRAGAV